MESKLNNINESILSLDVKEQLRNLGLVREMISGKILDIGAGNADFARAFCDKKEVEITSIDQDVKDSNTNLVIKADSRDLPFKDSSYDMVISHASIPHIFLDMYSFEFPEHSAVEIKSAISRSLSEIIRVLKSGKKAYMSPVLIGEDYESQRVVKKAIEETLDDLKNIGIKISFELFETIENPDNKEKIDHYRLIIQKPE